VTQRIFVNESEVGMNIPVVPIIGEIAASATSAVVSDASKLAALFAAGQLGQIRLGIGRNEETVNVSGVVTGGPERVDFSAPTNWRHYDLDYLMPSTYEDADNNIHHVTLLAVLTRPSGVANINTSMIEDKREYRFGSPAELRDIRLDLETSDGRPVTAGAAIEARIPYITLGLGTGTSIGRVNVSTSGNSVADAFAAAQSLLPDGGVIYVRPGTYTLETTTKIQITQANITIIGQAANLVTLEGLDEEVISVEASGFRLENITVLPGDSEYGVIFTGAWSDTHFENVIFNGSARSNVIIYVNKLITNTVFRDCQFVNGTKVTHPYVEFDSGVRITFDSCLFSGIATQTSLVYLNTIANYLWFSHCFFSSGLIGMLFNEAAVEGVKCVVTDSCFFYNQHTAAVQVSAPSADGYDYLFADCVVYSSVAIGFIITGAVRTKLSGCSILSAGTVALSISGSAYVTADHLRITNSPTGISLANTCVFNLDGIMITGSGTQTGIVTAGTCTVQVNGGMLATLDTGISAGSSTAGLFSNLRILLASNYAVNLTGAGQVLENITCEDCGSLAFSRKIISVSGNDCRLSSCRVLDFDAPPAVLGHAFYISGNDVLLQNCLSSEADVVSVGRGFTIAGARVVMENCTAITLPGVGLYIDAASSGRHQISNYRSKACGTVAGPPLHINGGTVSINGLHLEGGLAGAAYINVSASIQNAYIYTVTAGPTFLVLLTVGEYAISDSYFDGNDHPNSAIHSSNSTSLHISNCTFTNVINAFIDISAAATKYNTLITGCRFITGSGCNYAVFIDSDIYGARIESCVVDGNGANLINGFVSSSAATAVIGCSIVDVDDTGISLSGNGCMISGCYVYSASVGAYIGNAGPPVASGGLIQNCLFDGCDTGGYLLASNSSICSCSALGAISVGFAIAAGSSNCFIDSCVIGSTAALVPSRAGVTLVGTCCSIRNCGFYALDDAGTAKKVINISGDGNQIVGNYVYNCACTVGGIDVTGNRTQICNNLIQDINDDNIRLNAGSSGSIVSGNQLHASSFPAVIGIQVVGCDACLISNNRLNGFTNTSINVDNCDFTHVIGNHVSTGARAISVSTGTYPLIEGNYTYNCTDYGIYTSSARPSIVGNMVFSCPAAGLIQIEVSTATDGIFTNNSLWQVAGTLGDANLDAAAVADAWAGWKPYEGIAQALVNHNLMNALQNV